MENNSDLFKNLPPNYPQDKFYDHLLEQYKIYVEMSDNISKRRQIANSFYFSLNTALITIVNYVSYRNVWIVALSGIIICYSWQKLIKSYRDLNKAKFKVIQEIESKLPVCPYKEEWNKLEKGKNKKIYLPFTKIEIIIPWIFLLLHIYILFFIRPIIIRR